VRTSKPVRLVYSPVTLRMWTAELRQGERASENVRQVSDYLQEIAWDWALSQPLTWGIL